MNSESRNESNPTVNFRPNHRWQLSTWPRCSKPLRGRMARPAAQPTSNSNTAQLPRVPLKDALPGQRQQLALQAHVESHIHLGLSLTTPADLVPVLATGSSSPQRGPIGHEFSREHLTRQFSKQPETSDATKVRFTGPNSSWEKQEKQAQTPSI